MQLIEKSINSIISDAQDKNIGILSAFRSAYEKKENIRRTKELQKELNH